MVSPGALVKVLLAAASLAAGEPALTPGPSPGAAAPTALSQAAAARDLPLLPERPAGPKANNPTRWEYITVVTLLSAPFTALWYGLVFGIVEICVQRQAPPKFSPAMYEGLAAAVGATSLGIALVSVSWGGQAKPLSAASASGPSPMPSRIPAPSPTPFPSPLPSPRPLAASHG
jgi:subtilisin family serine protease